MMNIPLPVQKAMNVLTKSGYEANIVGGCVRDMLMGLTPHDYDIATNALPETVKRLFGEYTVVETGIKHGTVTAVIDRENIEITTYRIDGEYADNRRPQSVMFTSSLAGDLARRDFTVNAMAYSPDIGITDIYGGAEDIKKRVIKCVGSCDRRFNEDGLRIMRALRFAAVLGFEIEEETAESIRRNKHLLKNISAERIYSEFSRLVCGKNSVDIIRRYADVIGVFLPEITDMAGCAQNTKYHSYDVFEHTLHTFGAVEPKLALRFAALFHDIAKPLCKFTDKNGCDHFKGHQIKGEEMVRSIFNRLKSDNAIKNYVCALVRLHDENLTDDTADIRRRLSKYGYEFFSDLIMLRRADSLAHAEGYREFYEDSDKVVRALERIYIEEGRITLKELKLGGNDLIDMGITDGSEIGSILNRLLDEVLGGKLKNNHNDLKKAVQKWDIKKPKPQKAGKYR